MKCPYFQFKHIAVRPQPLRNKLYVELKNTFTPMHGLRKIKHESTTMAMRNADESADMKVINIKHACR